MVKLTIFNLPYLLATVHIYDIHDYETSEIFMRWDIGFACRKTDNIIKEACNWRLNTYNHQCMIFGRPSKETFLEFHNRLEHLCTKEQESVDADYNMDYENGAVTVKDVMENLRGYGCWCDLNSEFNHTGSGPPISELDAACKRYVESNKCISADSIREQADCPKDFKDYFVTVSLQPEKDFEKECRIFNSMLAGNENWEPDMLECAVKKCIVESKFLRNVIHIAVQPEFKFSLKGIRLERNGFFDVKSECVRSEDEQKPAFYLKGRALTKDYNYDYDYDYEDLSMSAHPLRFLPETQNFEYDSEHIGVNDEELLQCCGNYPHRFPIQTASTSCCDDKLNPIKYKVLTHECCVDEASGVKAVVPLNTCPFTIV